MAKRIRRTSQADRDIENLYIYSLKTFGPRQAESYVARLLSAIDSLSEFPQIGVLISRKGRRRRLIHEMHIVYYRVHPDSVEIVRVCDARRDQKRLIKPKD